VFSSANNPLELIKTPSMAIKRLPREPALNVGQAIGHSEVFLGCPQVVNRKYWDYNLK
jgi:hypothetical protein